MIIKQILIVLSLTGFYACTNYSIDLCIPLHTYKDVQRSNIKDIPNEYLLAMVAIHECINTCPQDASYIMMATWNRVLLNYGKYGSLPEQLLSSEFNGLIDKNFYFDSKDKRHVECLKKAKDIIAHGPDVRILGWYSKEANVKFTASIKNRVVSLPIKTCHTFWL